MVFTKICKHSSRAFIFASKSSDHICLASSEHFVNFQLAGISMLLVKCGKKRFVPGHIWPTPTKAAFKQHTTSRSLAHESGSEWALMRRSTSFLKRKSDNINTPRQEDKIYQTNNSPRILKISSYQVYLNENPSMRAITKFFLVRTIRAKVQFCKN